MTVNGSAGSGSVSFQDLFYPAQSLTPTTLVLAENVSLVGGQANYSSSTLAAGSHFVTAILNGSPASATRVQQIHLYDTLTALSASANPAVAGQPVVFTATVTSSGGGVPTGMVTFQEGTVLLTQVPLDASGTARFSSSTLTLGNHVITAIYSSDTLCAASSGTLTEAIIQNNTPPAQPTGLRATPGPNTKQVTLAWTTNPTADNVTAYEVWRAANQGSAYSQIATTTSASYIDTLQKSGQTRWYYVVARNSSGRSIPSVKIAGTAK